MKWFDRLFAATLLAACLWPPVEGTPLAQTLPASPAPGKTPPPDTSAPKGTGPFPVVEAKRREVPNDLATADALGIKAVRITSPASIEGIAPHHHAFKWVLTYPEHQLLALPTLDRHQVFTKDDRDIIKHVVATRGGQVQTAGIAQRRGDTLLIDPRSGHYRPSRASLEKWAVPAFKTAGFAKVEVRDDILSE